jgi:hypothetical protein
MAICHEVTNTETGDTEYCLRMSQRDAAMLIALTGACKIGVVSNVYAALSQHDALNRDEHNYTVVSETGKPITITANEPTLSVARTAIGTFGELPVGALFRRDDAEHRWEVGVKVGPTTRRWLRWTDGTLRSYTDAFADGTTPSDISVTRLPKHPTIDHLIRDGYPLEAIVGFHIQEDDA